MSFSLRGAISGAAGVVGQQQGLRISAATQAMRDQQLAKFQMDRQVQQQGFQSEQGAAAARSAGLLQDAKYKYEAGLLDAANSREDLQRASDRADVEEDRDVANTHAINFADHAAKIDGKENKQQFLYDVWLSEQGDNAALDRVKAQIKSSENNNTADNLTKQLTTLQQIEAQKGITAANIAGRREIADARLSFDEQSAINSRNNDLSDTAAANSEVDRREVIRQRNRLELGTADPKVAPKDIRGDKFKEKLAGADAVLFDKTRSGSMAAAGIEDSLVMLEEIMDNFTTGKTPDLLAAVGAYLGTEAGAARQTWLGAISPTLLIKAESMSGVLSNKDLQFLIDSLPSFGSSESANRKMIRLMRLGMDRLMRNNASMEAHISDPENNSLKGWSAPNQQGPLSSEGGTDETIEPDLVDEQTWLQKFRSGQ